MNSTHQQRFLELLEPVHDRLYRYALVVSESTEDAEDLTSDTILAAFEQFEKLRDTDRFLHLLLMIASRKMKRRRWRAQRQTPMNDSHAALAITMGLDAERAADLRIALEALKTLPDKMRETVALFDVNDLSLEEIRDIQGGTLSGVKSRLRRGRLMLASRLGLRAEVSVTSSMEKQSDGASEHVPNKLLRLASHG
jgi:RNA polymerase sigma-70 factor (ECF subfamily)